MTDDADFPIDGLLALEPSPDEEAWEAFLVFALEHLGGGDEATAIDMATLRRLEKALGVQLPFEIGLLLVIGVPDSDDWIRWGDDPGGQHEAWRERTLARILSDVETGGFWAPTWGERPDDATGRDEVVRSAYAAAAPLLPLHRNAAVPLTIADGEETAESNPIFEISGATVRVAGTDLAAWLNREFDVPLPMWPETPPREFTFWSDLLDDDSSSSG